MEEVWRCSMPPFMETGEKEPVWLGGSTTEKAVDAMIMKRLEDASARMYKTRTENNPMAFRMRIAWRDHEHGRIARTDVGTEESFGAIHDQEVPQVFSRIADAIFGVKDS
jgi:hypothetical protein